MNLSLYEFTLNNKFLFFILKMFFLVFKRSVERSLTLLIRSKCHDIIYYIDFLVFLDMSYFKMSRSYETYIVLVCDMGFEVWLLFYDFYIVLFTCLFVRP